MRRGFSLPEMLIVVSIMLASFILVATVATVSDSMRLNESISVVQAAVQGAKDRAVLEQSLDARSGFAGFSGFRIAKDRVVPLVAGNPYGEGKVSIRGDWPEGFAARYRRLVLEETLYDQEGVRNNPTSWQWNVRVGDVARVGESDYIVCGPVDVANAEGYVNILPPPKLDGEARPSWASPILDRGQGPIEYLYLVNAHDDDLNGTIDSGWNGLDDNLDGYIDDDDEWEPERWLDSAGVGMTNATYSIIRRPIPSAEGSIGFPEGVFVDFGASKFWGESAGEWADVLVDQFGALRPSKPYAIAQTQIGASKVSLRLRMLWNESNTKLLEASDATGKFIAVDDDQEDAE